MRKIIFVFVCVFIALGWVGCNNPLPKGPHLVREVYVDSTLTACGMDSFLIKSSWMQERINTFINTHTELFQKHNPIFLKSYNRNSTRTHP